MCVDDLPFLKNGDFPYGKVFDYRRVSFHPSDLLNTPQKKTWFKLVNRLFTYGGFLSHRGIYPEIIHVNGNFPYKPSSYWGTPIPGNPH